MAFTAREKNDIYRSKRRRFEVSAGIRGGMSIALFGKDVSEADYSYEDTLDPKEKVEILKNLAEHIMPDPSGADPAIDELVAGSPAYAEVYSMDIDELKAVGVQSYYEFKNDKKMDFRKLLYIRQAAMYQAKWILKKVPVDRIIAFQVRSISDLSPTYIDDRMKLSEVPGFVEPVEKDEITIPNTESIENVRPMVEEVKEYFFTHPYQFEAQCLLSVVTGTEDLTDILVKAWALLRWVDGVSREPGFGERPKEEIRELFDIWLIADLICRIGYTENEFAVECKGLTVGEATNVLIRELDQISFSKLLDQSHDTLEQILKERGHLDVL